MLIKKNFDQNLDVQKKTLEILEKKIYLASEILSKCLINNALVMWCGNGGSASDSMHLSAELIGRSKKTRKPLRSISLAADSPAITCISNDFGYENLFSRQIEGLGNENDILVSLTTSGNSPNIINAIKKAKELNLKTILMSGNSGGKCANITDLELLVPSTSTARIQEMHMLIGHTLCDLVEEQLNLN
jgi:D-sedoheptulose 7-phosphate isomerase